MKRGFTPIRNGATHEDWMSNLPPAPVPDAVVVSALVDSVVELRPLIEKLFANDQRAAGMVLAQLNAIYSRLLQGLPSRTEDHLSLLQAAQRVPEEKR